MQPVDKSLSSVVTQGAVKPWGASDAALLELAGTAGGPLLAIDSSAAQASLCLVVPVTAQVLERDLAAASLPSESLVTGIQEICAAAGLQVADLSALVIGLGPGSFTGLRVGLATVKGLALGAQLPVYGVSSLQLLAAAARRHMAQRKGAKLPATPTYVVAVRDARREALYAGLYAVQIDGGSQAVLADAVWTLAGLTRAVATALGEDAQQMAQILVVGDAAEAVAAAWHAQLVDIEPCARFAIAAAAAAVKAKQPDDIASLVPRYMRGEMIPASASSTTAT